MATNSSLKITWFIAITAYFSYAMLLIFGHIRDFFRRFFPDSDTMKTPKGYAPLMSDFEDFYRRRFYLRGQDCYHRPICSAASAWIDIWKRESVDDNKNLTPTNPPEILHCLNLGSYNYLGFSQPPPHVTKAVLGNLESYGVSCCSASLEFGYTDVHKDLEHMIARFVGKESSMVVGMGFATNSTVIPALCGKGTLIISDGLNHTSIVSGARSSGAKIKVFRHADMKHLERIVVESILEGQPRTGLPWKKIVIIVEGIYSMEGEIATLAEIVRIKKQYKCYLYVDEAHSIGGLGKTGRGVCEQTNVDPADVDILMGTFSKSFGAAGGYIASSKAVIDYLRNNSFAPLYGAAMPVPVAQQVFSVFKVIAGEDGTTIGQEKLTTLRENSNFFREGLRNLGFEVIGDQDSPVVVAMLYSPGRVAGFSRECLRRGIAVVVVAAPATPLLEARVRICVSAAHSREDLEWALKELSEVGDLTLSKFAQSNFKTLKSILC